MSGLWVVGLSHLTAPVAVREALAKGIRDVGALRELLGLSEAALLATCSRFELYGVGGDPQAAIRVFEEAAGRDLSPYLYLRHRRDAARHLIRVASGLDSWIVGETEILAQVRAAYSEAVAVGTAGRTLHILFQKSLEAAKRIRRETSLAFGFRSIGGAAALLARKIFGDEGRLSVLVLGAGAMARSTVRHLSAKGVRRISVANRTRGKAEALAAELGGTVVDFDGVLDTLANADVAVFSTGASRPLLDRAGAARAVAARGGRPLFVIDLGLPRNVAADAAEVEGVYLYDLDDLKRMVERQRDERLKFAAPAFRLLESAAADCWVRIGSGPAVLCAVEGNR
ncbi:MAG: glutamyl-tRNA reductase [Elusimicrobia bacterium CG1_02_63_36]|nr:MAG: glutamyl-tRNA reductase [Elusimicrobia bacterium CG1_02_63_36]PIP83399.1 MAG: glutamyl-tRNA reductase [Elusimicrobia bacterium CG22_combo_CG10-13_8_21_14_all_63_91]PJA13462.1 MAG: glutamyl-tRNA reductase [Elusimicrobia bacterium CG_4_10_14_0_2_um_filter_63_34]PJB25348.1 MAG: glutamyl-tRNA reductase [Elusimicrobia bacterium CG_4_9_14_3_um_filter_62_55]